MFTNSIMFIKLGRKGIKNISFCVYILYECYFNLGCLTHHQHLTEASPPSPAGPSPSPSPKGRGVITEVTPILSPAGPSPFPSPEGKGRNHRDTPMANHQHLTTITQHPSLAVTLCELCMPEAFCGLETVRKKALLTL